MPAFIHSPLLPAAARGSTYAGVFHVSDWLPTLISGALGVPDAVSSDALDGVDQMAALLGDGAPGGARDEMLYNVDGCCIAVAKVRENDILSEDLTSSVVRS